MADRDSIRALIRGVIEEEIGRLRPAEAGKATAEPPLRIDSDADLAAFARHVLVLARDPAVRADIERSSAAGASLIIAADTAQRTGALEDIGPLADFGALGPAERDRYCAEQAALLDGQ